MLYIKNSKWDKIPNDYKGKSTFNNNINVVLAGCVIKNGGAVLLYEHKHFKIVED